MSKPWIDIETLDEKQRAQIEAQLNPPNPVEQAEQPQTPASKHDVKLEKDLQGLCENELHRKGYAFLHLSIFAREKSGWPDLVFSLRRRGGVQGIGIPCAVELKSATGKLSAEQIKMLTRMKNDGWAVFVMRNFDTFRDLLLGHMPEEWAPEQERT